AIYVNGEVQAVTTAADLRRSVASSAEHEADLARKADRWVAGGYWSLADADELKADEAEADDCEGDEPEGDEPEAAILADEDPARDERLAFTAGTAAVISPGHWESLFVCLHLAELSNEVAEMLRKRIARSQAHPTISNGYGPPTLSKGAVLRLTTSAD